MPDKWRDGSSHPREAPFYCACSFIASPLSIVDAAEASKIRFHNLRHTAANLMHQVGVPREVQMRILGHRIRAGAGRQAPRRAR